MIHSELAKGTKPPAQSTYISIPTSANLLRLYTQLLRPLSRFLVPVFYVLLAAPYLIPCLSSIAERHNASRHQTLPGYNPNGTATGQQVLQRCSEPSALDSSRCAMLPLRQVRLDLRNMYGTRTVESLDHMLTSQKPSAPSHASLVESDMIPPPTATGYVYLNSLISSSSCLLTTNSQVPQDPTIAAQAAAIAAQITAFLDTYEAAVARGAPEDELSDVCHRAGSCHPTKDTTDKDCDSTRSILTSLETPCPSPCRK